LIRKRHSKEKEVSLTAQQGKRKCLCRRGGNGTISSEPGRREICFGGVRGGGVGVCKGKDRKKGILKQNLRAKDRTGKGVGTRRSAPKGKKVHWLTEGVVVQGVAVYKLRGGKRKPSARPIFYTLHKGIDAGNALNL